MSRLPIALLLVAPAALATACTSSPHLDLNAVPDGGGGCGVVVGIPPVLAVVDTATGAPICDATFTVISAPASASLPPDGGNVGVPCTPEVAAFAECSFDDAANSCPFALPWIVEQGTALDFSVEVAKPGFAPAIVSVHSGAEFCTGGPTPASDLVVPLSPSDAGADAGVGQSDAGEQ